MPKYRALFIAIIYLLFIPQGTCRNCRILLGKLDTAVADEEEVIQCSSKVDLVRPTS